MGDLGGGDNSTDFYDLAGNPENDQDGLQDGL